jgi:hypothetical protein
MPGEFHPFGVDFALGSVILTPGISAGLRRLVLIDEARYAMFKGRGAI